VLVVVSSIAVLVTSSTVLKSILSKLGDFEEVGFNDFEEVNFNDFEEVGFNDFEEVNFNDFEEVGFNDFEEVGFNDFELGDLDDLELDLEDVDELEPVFVWLCRLRDKARASVSIISTASSTVMGLRGMV
jgi:hypothetical protein